MEGFVVTRIFSNESGESCFDELRIPLTEAGPIGYLSEKYKVENLVFRKVLPEYDYEFHNAPARQFIILLDGEIEIETSLGEKRQFGAGDILLVEDTEGKGHKTRNLSPIERRSIFITL
ncbi:hypothetical protein [Pedobacter sp. SYSU D00535]|uniref:hypothetical protein n=1 Tax=Pedobacter sp. SYSU D00535 TaxID=2810308 RepID=UPI001A9596E9|nr:hypothetical protein [Pedobacter sp. SYSU D00535]